MKRAWNQYQFVMPNLVFYRLKKKLNKQVNNKQKANNVHSYQIKCEFIPPFSQPMLMTTCHLFREKRKKKVSSSLTAYRMMIMDLGERF